MEHGSDRRESLVKAIIFVEGGGDGQFNDAQFRYGWHEFFKAAGLVGHMPQVVRGKGRQRTFGLFKDAVENPKPGEIPLLLVDSEKAVASSDTVWQHLRKSDDLKCPDRASDEQAFLMVQVMETWFLADRDLLRGYFDARFTEKPLRPWPSLEDVPKDTILEALDRATAGCAKRYSKGKVSYELLSKLNPALVKAACPHARDLLERLIAIAVGATLLR